ncbi:MAG: serine/threonine protein kinase, partial [Planctomycetota bacterium]
VWMVNRAGVLFVLDLETGTAEDAKRLKSGSIWATPLATADHLYLFGHRGITSVLRFDTEEEIATNKTWEFEGTESKSGEVLYAVAVAEPNLIVRRGDRLYAIPATAAAADK